MKTIQGQTFAITKWYYGYTEFYSAQTTWLSMEVLTLAKNENI